MTAIISISLLTLLAIGAALGAVLFLAPRRGDQADVQSIRSAAMPTDRTSTTADPDAWGNRQADLTIEYLDPLTSQRVTIAQDRHSFGIDAAHTTARATAMMYRGVNVEIWQADIATGHRKLINAMEMEPRSVA